MDQSFEFDGFIEIQNIINKNIDKSIIVLDSWNKIVFINKVFEQFTGYTLQEVKGASPLTIGLGESSPQEFLELIDSVTKGDSFNGTFKNSKKDGEEYYTNSTIIPIYKNPKKINYYIVISCPHD